MRTGRSTSGQFAAYAAKREDAEAPRAEIVPAVRLYIHSDEIQSTVTELADLREAQSTVSSVSLFPTA